MQDRVGSRRDLVKAVRAGIDAAVAQLVELAFNTALRAVHERAAKPHSHDVFKACLIVREAGKELANAELGAGRGAFLRHAPLYRSGSNVGQGDNRVLL